MAASTPPNKPRKRGGQLGNQNALKHGFYARHFKSGELADLDALLSPGLADEITMLRVVIRRTLELANGSDLEEATKTLAVLGAAATRLAGLLRTQKILDGGSGDAAQAIARAISEVAQELGLLHH